MTFDDLVETLAQVAYRRHMTAVVDEGKTPLDAMREVVRVILTEYKNRMAQ